MLSKAGSSLKLSSACPSAAARSRAAKATSFSPSKPGVLEFEMFDITNLKDASTPHVQRIVYRVIDGRRMTLDIFWKNGQSEESEKYTLSRI